MGDFLICMQQSLPVIEGNKPGNNNYTFGRVEAAAGGPCLIKSDTHLEGNESGVVTQGTFPLRDKSDEII